MPIVTDLPDARVVSLKQIYDWVANNTTTVPSGGDLIDKGWLPLIRAGIVTITSNGYIAWGLDASGTSQVVEDNSSNIFTNTGKTKTSISNGFSQSRLQHEGTDPEVALPPIFFEMASATLAAGGTLATTSILAAVAAKTWYVERIAIHLSMHSAIPSGSALVTVEDEDGNDMGIGTISNEGPHLIMDCLEPAGADNKAVHLLVAAGGVHLNASNFNIDMYMRQL